MDKIIKEYLDRAAEIVGERTESEIFYDDAVIGALSQGRTIKDALLIAAKKYPEEALECDDSNIGDIAAHYDYLREHARILKYLKKQGKMSGALH